MKKSILSLLLLLGFSLSVCAQKIVLIDTEYILKNVPTYTKATSQMEASSKKWQAEVEALSKEAKTMYTNYQTRMTRMTAAQKTTQENAIVAKEKSAADLKRKYFGPEGELAKMRQNLIKPIQDQIYNAVKSLSERYGYAMVVDRASATSVIFASPEIDISDDVLAKMGYSK
jgi:outer membrane protein